MFPPYLEHWETWIAFWPVPVAAIIIAGLLTLVVVLLKIKLDPRTMLITLLGFALLGLVVGVLSGQSREPAIGAVMPAVLSFVGGVAAFLMGKGSEVRATVSLGVVAFSLSILLGTNWGANNRLQFELWQTSLESKESAIRHKVALEQYEQEVRAWYADQKKLSSGPPAQSD